MTIYLTLRDALDVIDLLGLPDGSLRDPGLLVSALGRPRASAFGADAYPTLATKAAALLHSLARNHVLVDGNKRLAWICTRAFLRRNGHDLAGYSVDDAEELVLSVARGDVDADMLAVRLGRWIQLAEN